MESLTSPAGQDIGDGFAQMRPFGRFHELVGPLYETLRNERTVVGMRVDERHLNGVSILHGGMYFMLLDTAMTRACVRLRRRDSFPATISLSSELLAAARPGDWIEAEVEILRAGKRLIFLNCIIRRGGPDGEPLARGSATFQMITSSPSPS